MTRPLLVFDMDGVLAEVGDSYRAAIAATVLHFTSREPSRDAIQDYKNSGGWNNDWELSQQLCRDFGVEVPFDAVVAEFNRLFLGDNFNGLILRERWAPRDGLLERLGGRFQLAIFTGRPLDDAAHTLRRFAPDVLFSPIVTMESVTNHKPAPDGLKLIMAGAPGAALTYVGDTVDDARSARAAGVPFIGIAAQPATAALLGAEGAIAVLGDINEIEGVLPA